MAIQNTKDTDQKALEINLNDQIYGTFAEIGAGQEVARFFFKVGAAAGTIAKTMSAYDKTYSDEIYGLETSGRYVCESRLKKMLDHEYELLSNRLSKIRPDNRFFVFADTIATLNYSRTVKGDGWLGLRFQLKAGGGTNDLLLHVRMLDNTTSLQQSAVGILGVNLLYACFEYADDPEKLICSLVDDIKGRVEIDMVRLEGADFDIDNRLLAYWLVKHKLSSITMFGADGRNIHASELLYKKHIMVVRSNFRPVTLVTEELIHSAFQQFCEEDNLEAGKDAFLFAEMMPAYKGLELEDDVQDFLDRADMLNLLGHAVIVSNCNEHEKLVDYFTPYKFKKLGIAIGAKKLSKIIRDKYKKYADSSLLEAFGKLFRNKVTVYVYPAQPENTKTLITIESIKVPDELKFLYQYLIQNGRVVDINSYHLDILHIFSKDTLKKLRAGDKEWEQRASKVIVDFVKEKEALGYKEI